MLIGGFQKQSLIDYPGKISSVIFTAGCNFRCGFCHNPDLVIPERIKNSPKLSQEKILQYFKENKELLDAVSITGGEPTLQKDLIDFIKAVKEMNLAIKLDTNGTNPETIKKLIEQQLIDFIAMDIKAPLELEKYKKLAGTHLNQEHINNILKTIQIILDSGIKHDFRTTIIKEHHTKQDIMDIIKDLKNCKVYSLQKFNPYVVLDKNYKNKTSFDDSEVQEIIKEIKKIIPTVNFR
jgi:pyruvate formate lyase activating enzyme